MDLISNYINDGRFGEFVEEFINIENEREKKEAEAENDRKLWEMYLHSQAINTMPFTNWKEQMIATSKEKPSYQMNRTQVDRQIEKSRNLLKKFSL